MHCPPHARQLQFLIGVYVGLPLEDKRVNWRGSNPRFTSEINRSGASHCIEPGFELYLTRRQALVILC